MVQGKSSDYTYVRSTGEGENRRGYACNQACPAQLWLMLLAHRVVRERREAVAGCD